MILSCLILSILVKADFEVDGFTYHELDSDNDTAKAVQVVNCSKKDELTIIIPSNVKYNDITYTVTSISTSSFSSSGITQFNSIYFPYTLKDIEESAFQKFSNLAKIGYINENNQKIEDTLPPQLSILNKDVFSYTSITTINVNNVASLRSAFSNCQNLTKVVLPQVPFELVSTFSSCSNLVTVENFEYCTSITGGFNSCSELSSLAYAPNLNTIGDYSFYGCEKLTEFEFSEGLSEIGDSAFFGCKNIKSIDLKNVKIVGSSAFRSCIRVSTLNIPKVEEIGRLAFSYIQSLTEIELPSTIKVLDDFCFTETAVIHITGNPELITELGSSFTGCKDLVSLPVFKSLKIIRSEALKKCNQLEKFECGDQLSEIWSNGLESSGIKQFITTSKSVRLSGEAFLNCARLSSFDFSIISEISNNAFEGCVSLDVIDFSKSSITELPWQTFYSCGDLSRVILPPNISEFSILAFEECSIHTIEFSNTGTTTLNLRNAFSEYDVELIEAIFSPNCKVNLDHTFCNCHNLSRVVLPQVPYELPNTFSSCSNLSIVENFEYCTSITGGFNSCSELSSLAYAPNLNTIGDYSFYGCEKLTEFEFSEGLSEIGDSAFFGCKNIKSIDLKNVKIVGSSAFRSCIRVSTLNIPKVEEIGRLAFSYIQSLTEIELPSTIKVLDDFCFTETAVIHITGNPELITELGSSFTGCKDLVSLPVFKSLKIIRSEALKKCNQLEKFECGDQLSEIWSNGLESSGIKQFITTSKSVRLSGEAFLNCARLSSFDFSIISEISNNAFEGCVSLDVIDFSKSSITELPWQTFYSCGDLSRVILPPNISEFSILAFEECSIHTIEFSNTGTTTLNLRNAFSEYDVELIEAIFSPNCKVNLDHTFCNCHNLSRVVLPQVPYELPNTFSSCSNLSIVENFEYCTSITGGFNSCSELSSLAYAPNLNTIGDYSFYGCEKLTEFEFSEGLSEIGDSAFFGCKNIKSIDLKNVKIVGSSAFRSCIRVSTLNIPKVEEIGRLAFSYIQSLTEIELPSTIKVLDDFCFTETAVIHITGNPELITELGSSFTGCKDLVSLPVFKSLKIIRSEALKKCNQLEKFECGDQLSEIWSNGLESSGIKQFITTSKSVRLSGEAFLNCARLSSFDFSIISEISNNAFEGCVSLDVIDFSKSSITELPWQTFYSCGDLSRVILPPNISEFSILAFEECSIHTIEFSNTGTTTLNLRNAFSEYDVELIEAIFSPNCKVNLDHTFCNCHNLSRVVLPQVPYELPNTFSSCSNLSIVENFKYCTSIVSGFANCTKLAHLEPAPSLSNIGDFSFYKCELLQSVTLSDIPSASLTIGKSAFESCHSLSSFDFSLWHDISVGERAFADCPLSGQSELVFGHPNASNSITIQSHAFSSPAVSTVTFESPINNLNLSSDSFSDCSNISCVMVDKKWKKKAAVAFDDDLINGEACPNYDPSSSKKKTALIVGCAVGGAAALIFIIIVVVFVVKKKNRTPSIIEQPIFTTYDERD